MGEVKRLQNASYGSGIPDAVGEFFSKKKFSDVLLFPARDEDDGPEFVRCNSTALACASPFMARILCGPEASVTGREDLCLTLECSLDVLRQLAAFVHTGRTEVMDEEQEKEFRKWNNILEIQADVSRMAFGQDLAFRCPFCLGKAFQTVKEAIRHLEKHKEQLRDKAFFDHPDNFLCWEYVCPVCGQVPVNVRARMDEETRRQFFAHNRSCRKRLDAQLEALRKGGHAAGKGRIECERCGKCLRTDMARKKHLAACTGEGNTILTATETARHQLEPKDPGSPASSTSSSSTSVKRPQSKQRRETKCQDCGEDFPTREGLRLHTCDDGRRSKLDLEGIADDRTARKVRPEAGALREPPDAGDRTRRKARRRSGGSTASSNSSDANKGPAFNVTYINKPGTNRSPPSMEEIQKNEDELHRKIQSLRSSLPKKVKVGDRGDEGEEAEKASTKTGLSTVDLSSESNDSEVERKEEEEDGGEDDKANKKKGNTTKGSDARGLLQGEDISSEEDEEEEKVPLKRSRPGPASAKRGGRGRGHAERDRQQKKAGQAAKRKSRSTTSEEEEERSAKKSKAKAKSKSPQDDFMASLEDDDNREVSVPPPSAQEPRPPSSSFPSYSCQQCGQSFSGNLAFMRHRKQTGHKLLDEDDEEDPW